MPSCRYGLFRFGWVASSSPLLGEALMPVLALAGKPVCSVFEFFLSLPVSFLL